MQTKVLKLLITFILNPSVELLLELFKLITWKLSITRTSLENINDTTVEHHTNFSIVQWSSTFLD